MKTIQFMAGQLARAQMAETLCKNQDAFKNVNPVQLFEAMSKRNAILIARQMDELEGRGGNPASFMKDMEKQIEKPMNLPTNNIRNTNSTKPAKTVQPTRP